MGPSPRVTQICDFIGTGALVGALIVGGSGYLIVGARESTLMMAFLGCLGTSVAAYMVARLPQIAHVMLKTPSARQRRARQAPAKAATSPVTDSLIIAEIPAAVSSDLQRAA